MKTILHCTIMIWVLCGSLATGQTDTYTNFIRQVQYPGAIEWDVSVEPSGQQLSALAINPGGARFEMWTVRSSPLASFLLDSSYVGTYIPVALVAVQSEDSSYSIPRTRADRPFTVNITVSGMLNGPTDPVSSKSVNFLRYVQSYGVAGTGVGLDRTQATVLTESSITANGVLNLTFILNSVPGANRSKVRGEERFSLFSLPDYQAPASQLASQTIQIWPVADGTIAGITQNQLIRFSLPQVTLILNDLYPNSTTYAQVYRGDPQLGTVGIVVPGSGLVINDSAPQSRVLNLTKYDAIFDSDGRWTIEILTVTPFGVDRLAYVSFDLDRTIQLNGSFNSIE